MRRTVAVVLFASTMLAWVALPAKARGVWDPDDTDGRLDVRWVGVREASGDALLLTVAFYSNFIPRAIPTVDCRCRRELWLSLDSFMQARLFRKNGRIKMAYFDYRSDCCDATYRARQPNPDTLVVRFIPEAPHSDDGSWVYAQSVYRNFVDLTDMFHISPW